MEKIREHLRGRPIAPIFQASTEKESEVALKVMCIIDYFIAKRNMNEAIDTEPKLREQLLHWSSFENFWYYIYSAPADWFTTEVLQCKRCEFIGPYLTTLTHMAVNHDLHIGLKKCVWCDRVDFETHVKENTKKECYEMYLAKQQIPNVHPHVVTEFYDMLKTIAGALRVRTRRSVEYASAGYKSKDYLLGSDSEGEVDQVVLVFNKKRKRTKEIDPFQLKRFFELAMHHFHGRKAAQFYNAFANKSSADSSKDDVDSDEHEYRAKRMRTTSASTQSSSSVHSSSSTQFSSASGFGSQSPFNTTNIVDQAAYAAEIALRMSSLKTPEIKQRTMRLIEDVIANGESEDKNTTP